MHPRCRSAVLIPASALMFMFLPLTHAAMGSQSCRMEATLPAAYAGSVQADLHQPAETWPERVAAPAGTSHPTIATHGQLLLGRDTLYFYHLPVFMTDPWQHPHNFQVILEISFDAQHGSARQTYVSDRDQHPSSIYTAVPPVFAQTALVLEYPGRLPLRQLSDVTIIRNHFERGGQEITKTPVTVERVVHFREFAPAAPKPEAASYILFGRTNDLFLAHLLSAPPDFDQILQVTVEAANVPEAALLRGMYLTLPDHPNAAARRLRPGEILSCDGGIGSVRLRIVAEPYCETGELAHVVGDLSGKGFGHPRACPGALP
jgi:hypothetical protein